MVLARLDVCLRERERLAESSAALGRDDNHAGGWRTLEHNPPLILCEVGLSSHATLPLTRSPTTAGQAVADPGPRRSAQHAVDLNCQPGCPLTTPTALVASGSPPTIGGGRDDPAPFR